MLGTAVEAAEHHRAAARHAVKVGLAAEAPDGVGAELGDALEVLPAVRIRGDARHLDERPQQVLECGALPGGESFERVALQGHVPEYHTKIR